MATARKSRIKHPNLNQPETLPVEVRQQVIELNELRRVMLHYAALFENLPSFQPFNHRIDELQGVLAEIRDWIERYLDAASESDFDSFEFEMVNLIAEGLTDALDSSPTYMTGLPATASQGEEDLRDDADALMERVWGVISDQGYKLHTKLIRA